MSLPNSMKKNLKTKRTLETFNFTNKFYEAWTKQCVFSENENTVYRSSCYTMKTNEALPLRKKRRSSFPPFKGWRKSAFFTQALMLDTNRCVQLPLVNKQLLYRLWRHRLYLLLRQSKFSETKIYCQYQ